MLEDKEKYKKIILGAVRTRTPLTLEHFLSKPETRSTVLDVLSGNKVAWELINFGGWSWRRAFAVITSGSHGRLKILDSQRNFLLNHPKRGNNRPISVEEIVKQRQKLT